MLTGPDHSAAFQLGACLFGAALTLATFYLWPMGPPQWGRAGPGAIGRRPKAFEGGSKTTGPIFWSTMLADSAMKHGPGFAGSYIMFHNVAWEDGAIGIAAEDPKAELPAEADGGIIRFCAPPCKFNTSVELRVRRGSAERAADDPFRRCRVWVDEPVILFNSIYPNNFYHYICQGVGGVLYVLEDCGVLPRHIARLSQPSDSNSSSCLISPNDDVMVVAMDPSPLKAPWRYILDAITSDQHAWPELRGHCFRTLVIAKETTLAFTGTFVERDVAGANARFQKFSKLAFLAALGDKTSDLGRSSREERTSLLQEGCQAQNLPGASLKAGSRWRSGGDLPRVTWSSRHGGSRDVLNEEDIFAFIRDQYDVEMVNTTFGGHLYDAMQEMHRTDLFLGMHGAGMTNIMWLPVGVTVLQLFPYGWQLPSGEVMRERLYSQMVQFKNGSHLRWVNPYPHNAFLQRENFEKDEQWREHPDNSTDWIKRWKATPVWQGQHTYVDMESFGPVLEEAFATAGVPKRSKPSAAR